MLVYRPDNFHYHCFVLFSAEDVEAENSGHGLFYYVVVCLGGVVAVVLVVLRRKGGKGECSFTKGLPSPLPTHSTMERILGKSNRKQK